MEQNSTAKEPSSLFKNLCLLFLGGCMALSLAVGVYKINRAYHPIIPPNNIRNEFWKVSKDLNNLRDFLDSTEQVNKFAAKTGISRKTYIKQEDIKINELKKQLQKTVENLRLMYPEKKCTLNELNMLREAEINISRCEKSLSIKV